MLMQEIVEWRVVVFFNDMLGLALLIEKSFSDYLSSGTFISNCSFIEFFSGLFSGYFSHQQF